MDTERFTTDLMCSVCGRITLQEATYAGRLLSRITCTHCGNVVHVNPDAFEEAYIEDLKLRLRSKPHRMLQRAAKHPLRFVGALPGAALRQPAKLYREIKLVARESKSSDSPPSE